MYFPSTHWSLIARATLDGEAEARSALEELCRRYWSPLKQFIRARGFPEAEAEDLTQEFLLHLLERATLRKPNPLRGKFRSFLLGALANFLSHERERRLAQKRGGQQPHVSLDALGGSGELSAGAPSLAEAEVVAFDRIWALAVVTAVLAQVEQDYRERGKGDLFSVLRAFLPGGNVAPAYDEAAARAGLSLAAFNSEIHRLRKHFRECIRTELAATVSAPHEIDDEVTHLYRVLMDRGTDPESDGKLVAKTVSNE